MLPQFITTLAGPIHAPQPFYLMASGAVQGTAGDCFSKGHMIRRVRKYLGMTAYDDLLTRREGMAQIRLHTRLLSIREHAGRLSLNARHYVSDFFKKGTSLSPSNYGAYGRAEGDCFLYI